LSDRGAIRGLLKRDGIRYETLMWLPAMSSAVEFMTRAKLQTRLRGVERARISELIGLGYLEVEARAIATKELSEYDVLEMDDRGRVRIMGLELPEDPS
jgi:hypothetical protein